VEDNNTYNSAMPGGMGIEGGAGGADITKYEGADGAQLKRPETQGLDSCDP